MAQLPWILLALVVGFIPALLSIGFGWRRRALAAEDALWDLLGDVEGGCDFGMPFTHPDNPFHASVTRARRLLNR